MSTHHPILSDRGNGRPDFTVYQLTVFRAVAQHLSYTQTAQELYLSQPAVTQHIRALELMLGNDSSLA